MSRVPLTVASRMSPDMQSKFGKVTEVESGLSETYRALFASPQLASTLSGLDELVRGEIDLEPWIRLSVALTVAHERDSRVLWDSLSRWPERLESAMRLSMESPQVRRRGACCQKRASGCTSP